MGKFSDLPSHLHQAEVDLGNLARDFLGLPAWYLGLSEEERSIVNGTEFEPIMRMDSFRNIREAQKIVDALKARRLGAVAKYS